VISVRVNPSNIFPAPDFAAHIERMFLSASQ